MSEVEQQTLGIDSETRQPEAAKPAEPETKKGEQAEQPVTPKAPDTEELDKLRERVKEFELKEAEAAKAKMSEAERVASERAALELDRFRLDLEKAGVPTEVVALFPSAPEKGADKLVSEIAATWDKAVKAAAKSLSREAAPQGPAAIDPVRPPTSHEKPADYSKTYRDIAKQMSRPKRASGS